MADFGLEREVRTPYSEVYAILEGESRVGRVDIHFAYNIIQVCLTVAESLTEDSIHELADIIEQDLLMAAGIPGGELVIQVFQGRPIMVLSDSEYGSNGNES